MKKYFNLMIAFLITVMICGLATTPVMAYTTYNYNSAPRIESEFGYENDTDITVKLNGKEIQFDQPPILVNDRTLVPMRAIFEAMDCDVYWNEENQAVNVSRNNSDIMLLWIGGYEMWTQNGWVELDVPPQVVNDRTLVPVRAISETIGAKVEWNDRTQTVVITYKKTINFVDNESDRYENNYKSDCKHKNTHEALEIDLREYEDINSSSKHRVIDTIVTVCDDCSKTIETNKKEKNESHTFERGICEYCGYEDIDNIDDVDKPDYNSDLSTEVSDYVDGAFMYVTVPAGKSIRIPNTSESTLKVNVEGVGNIIEIEANGNYDIRSYNQKDTKYPKVISKKAVIIVQNSGSNDLIVSIPSEYATYYETDEKVFEIMYVSEGESIQITPSRDDKGCKFYSSGTKYEFIEFNPWKKAIDTTALKKIYTYNELGKSQSMLITANEDMEFYYCPFTTYCEKSAKAPYTEIKVESKKTVRISTTKESKSRIYTDGESVYDAVLYTNEGKVTSQKQGSHYEYVGITKNSYLDFTNKENFAVTLKIPTLYTNVE